MKNTALWRYSLSVLCCLLIGCDEYNNDTMTRLTIAQGSLLADQPTAGTVGQVVSFRGIPYASAPIGERRWAAPQKHNGWQGTRLATEFGAACPQTLYPRYSPSFREMNNQSEDCLFINVWTNNLGSRTYGNELLPVVVWIHGGSFIHGSGDSPATMGGPLAAKGVVVVSFNYRLGVLGHLAHPQLSAEQGGTSGNYAALDQIVALQWVKDNIIQFGGDPDRVTLMGQSSGSVSVNNLLISPLAKGLFQGVIGHSAASFATQQTLSQAEQVGEKFVAGALAYEFRGGLDGQDQVQYQGQDEQLLETLRDIPFEDLLDVFSQLKSELTPGSKGFKPNIDGQILPGQVRNQFSQGNFHKVPTLLGYNRDEGSVFALYPENRIATNHAEFEQRVNAFFGPAAPLLLSVYPEIQGSTQPYTDFWRDGVLVWSIRQWATASATAQVPTWFYHFSHTPSTEVGQRLGAFHSAELPYVFGTVMADQDDDKAVQATMMAYWVNFIRYGNPNGALSSSIVNGLKGPAEPNRPGTQTQLQWPKFDVQGTYFDVNAAPSVGTQLNAPQMKVWDLVLSQ